ncbi:MAG: glycoside hydrolase family 1 protein [Candidatus Omnitrophica bacterium]|nr:glycoside hydrolase family 1 protein [Candidatus Omnitrophota bacterium]
MSEFTFPQGFLWGAATSAHQVEGNNVYNDWWAWEKAGRVKESSGLACDHYLRFREDFDLAASLGHKTHRFSIEWSRIEPEEGRWDDQALAHYVEVIQALRERNIEPVVTLHHFTSPVWLASQGGWTNPKSVEAFARFVERVAIAVAGKVRYWTPINEPMVYLRMHYIQGLGPPGMRDWPKALRVIEHLLRAHAASFHILHRNPSSDSGPTMVGVAHYLPVCWPCRSWWLMDRWAAARTERLFSWAVVEALTRGRWAVPGLAALDIPEARGTLDFLGVNFYGRQFIHWQPGLKQWPAESCDLGHHTRQVTERTSMGWDISPKAFYEVLRKAGSFGVPLFITENGAFMANDEDRWRFLIRHVQAVAAAIRSGVPILGYCYWSLMDNFEWAEGFTPRFGLIEVDYATQRRTIRESAKRYAEICRTNRVELNGSLFA